MNNINAETSKNTVPYIKRTINGRTYTVKIHFNPDSKETAKDMIRRMLKNDCQQYQQRDKGKKKS